MKMFEYMAAGRAIVTSDLPVIREVLNEKSAVFCEPDDVDAWKSAIMSLLVDEGRRLNLGNKAKTDVRSFTWQERERTILRTMD
jgi:glycosyltransferase involved in cell wall biosynthesis